MQATQPGQKVVHVQASVKRSCTVRLNEIADAVVELVCRQEPVLVPEQPLSFAQSALLQECLESLEVSDMLESATQMVDAIICPEVFQLTDEEPFIEQNDNYDVGDSLEDSTACEVTTLPHRMYHKLWESLIFESGIKKQLLQYVETVLIFSERGIDPNLITFNRVLLLHGPLGTGKTSICKALAQRAAIRLGRRFGSCSLVEINAHSLFSKWFSESGKLVGKLFTKIRDMVQDGKELCFILIDEVESLAAARKSALSGAEPSDALRVVNALLTQLDSLRRFSNVFIMATSNITEAIDVAFVDRADLKLYIGLPPCAARYRILCGAVTELIRKGLVISPVPLSMSGTNVDMMDGAEGLTPEMGLWEIATLCEGMSGRGLRKVPFLAFTTFTEGQRFPCQIQDYFVALHRAVLEQKEALRTISAH